MRCVMFGCLAAALAAAGCGSGGGPVLPVNGIVTLDGKPLDGATVTFYPEGGGNRGFARTGTDGRFVITGMKGEEGLPPGQYKVTVSKLNVPTGGEIDDPTSPAIGAVTEADIKSDLPAIYSDPSKTILSYAVTGDGKPIEIQLDSKRKK
jgi:hypothetical protein